MMIKKTLKLSGLHCASCCLVIEGELEDIGVQSKCDFVKQTAEVEYNPAEIDDKKIARTIEKQGYKVIL
jgi:copper chaperone CopZ